jgi:DNA polymerase-3 subunit epsilon
VFALARRPRAPHARGRAPWRDAPYVALDFETTGLDYATDHVISYGVVPIDGGRIMAGQSRHVLVKPPKAPSARSQTVHLLRPTDLAEAPTMGEAAAAFRRELDGRIVLAWFAEVEIAFLRGIYGGSQAWWRRRVLDVRDLAIAVDGGNLRARAERGYGLSQTADRYGVPVTSPHDALDDALVTAQLFLVLVGKLPGRPAPTVGDLRAAARLT